MNQQLFKKQTKVFNLFSVMRTLEELEYPDSITDDGYPKVCHFCDGFKEYRHDKSLEGHKDDCQLTKNKGKVFNLIVQECSDMEEGNFFFNFVTGMYFNNVI